MLLYTYIAFYAPNIAHRRSISPPTIMDRFLDQLKTSLILEKKMTSDDFGARGRGAKIVSLASRSETPVRRFLAAAAAHICAAWAAHILRNAFLHIEKCL